MQTFLTLSENDYDTYLSSLRADLLFIPYGDNIREERKQAAMCEAQRLALLHGLRVIKIKATLED